MQRIQRWLLIFCRPACEERRKVLGRKLSLRKEGSAQRGAINPSHTWQEIRTRLCQVPAPSPGHGQPGHSSREACRLQTRGHRHGQDHQQGVHGPRRVKITRDKSGSQTGGDTVSCPLPGSLLPPPNPWSVSSKDN